MSELLAAVAGLMAGITGSMVQNSIANKKVYEKNIIQERKEWRDKIRDLTSELNRTNFKSCEKIDYQRIKSEFQTRLNPYSEDEEDKKIIETLDKFIQNREKETLNEFNERVSYLLKYDWEIVKIESTRNFFLKYMIRYILILTVAVGIQSACLNISPKEFIMTIVKMESIYNILVTIYVSIILGIVFLNINFILEGNGIIERRVYIKDMENKDILSFEKEYIKHCTFQGLLGKNIFNLIRSTPIVIFIVVIISLYLNITRISEIPLYIGVILIIIYVFIMAVISKWKIRDLTKNKLEGLFSLENEELRKKIREKFHSLLSEYNIMNSEGVGFEKVDYLIKHYKDTAKRKKYDWIKNNIFLGTIILPIWIKIIDIYGEIIIKEHIVFFLTSIFFIFILGKMFMSIFFELIINFKSKQFFELANKLEMCKNKMY